MSKDKMQVVYKSVDELIPYVNNARTHSDKQVTQIAASIKEFGFNNPILLDGTNGVVAGHGRLMAAKKLKIKDVPCIELSHLSETQKKAYILADNKIALNADWDEKLLSSELEDLGANGVDFNCIGFDDIDAEIEKENAAYTRKIEAPIYQPSGECPKISEIIDRIKTLSLLSDIEKSSLPEDTKTFLRFAAERHTVFKYDLIAEFYCHADAETQRLMEDSALVIIDFNKAIENGFVKMTQEIQEAYVEDYGKE